MKRYTFLSACSFAMMFLLCSCNDTKEDNAESNKSETKTPKLKEETVNYTVDTLKMNSYVVYDENMEGKRPAVLVVHEWWGLNDYTKRRARMLAELGYIAMAIDMYGNNRQGNNPQEAGQLSASSFGTNGSASP